MTEANPHVLVCDDEPDLRDMVGHYLSKRGFRVTLAEDGVTLQQKLDEVDDIDAILLDINMPGEDGLTILRKLRAERDVVVIMLTAAGDAIDRIVGLEMGADDYLGKPVDLRELEARIKTVLRRVRQPATDTVAPGNAPAQLIEFDGLKLDITRALLFDRDGNEIALTAMEFRLLRVFSENRGRVLNRDQLLELAHDRGWDPYDRSIDIRISRLRRKIEKQPTKPELLRTVRGLGYVFDPA